MTIAVCVKMNELNAFLWYIKRSEDVWLDSKGGPLDLIKTSRSLHFGSALEMSSTLLSDQQFTYILIITIPLRSQRIRALFSDMFSSSWNAEADPRTCITLVKLRAVHTSGILQMAALFTGKHWHKLGTPATGISCASNTPIVIELTEIWIHYVRSHLFEMGNSDEEVIEMIGSREVWYGTVDGAFRHGGIIYLTDKSAEWSTFIWYVSIISNTSNIQSYRHTDSWRGF